MQNSELYRRGFVVPLSEFAEKALSNNAVEESTTVQFYELSNDKVFEGLWEKGLFESINRHLGTVIDDYEEEKVEAQSLPSLRKIIKEFLGSAKIDFLEREAVSELLRLCDIAIENNRSVFFIL
ncbi:hypothetical protein QQ020_18235 [Fulvivirgaceae bacterium BMA12]|uniref:Uncharacterized protein n=1 Tax=Agaribacillus aureus TaxID=3051825 RepID=A0ABT8L9U6_9BACT|nr:hypothetical protein [Fulvivirgaceae bacterium BMA12]